MSTTDIGSYVVTGGAHGVGRAIAERLARDGHVVVLDPGAAADGWIRETARVTGVAGDAGDDSVGGRSALGVDPEARNVIRSGRPGDQNV